MRTHRITVLAALLLCTVLAAPAFAGFGAGVAAGYLHIEIGDGEADTYQVGPMLDYWSDDAPWGFAAKALFSTYTFDFSAPVTGFDASIEEEDDNFRVDLDIAGRYLVNDWLMLLAGYRYELQDFDSTIALTGDPNDVATLLADARVVAVLEDANRVRRGFQVHSLAIAATVFTSIEDWGTTPYFTATIFPLSYVDSDIRALAVNPDLTTTLVEADDVVGFGGFAFEGGVAQGISAVEGLSVGLGVRYQQMTIFSDDDLLLLDDEILISVLPYLLYSF